MLNRCFVSGFEMECLENRKAMKYQSISLSFIKSLFSLLLLLVVVPVTAQVSYGGQPLPFYSGGGRTLSTAGAVPFVELPSVSNEASLWRAEVEHEEGGFRSLEFAHKHHVNLTPKNSGVWFTAGGRKVWRLGIRSQGAFSLNILLAEFELPKGAQLFIYNGDQSEILGAYTHRNNSDLNLLPVQPLGGDELIIEYQEPLDAEFEGRLMIGEVNHDFRGIMRATQPRDPAQHCHPNLVCYPEDIEPGSGVVGLIINGTTYCTGSLLNNSAEDGTPYLLTATHCLNRDYHPSFLANPYYDVVAGSIVAFFGYDSPVCEGTIRGPVQMSVASADSVLILEAYDISLLKLKEVPPVEYQPYYLGWNREGSPQPPYHGIHHPNGGYKKVAIENEKVLPTTFIYPRYNMAQNGHWDVRWWDVGVTEGGSSGSPLLDKNKRVIGALTGGESYCSSPKGPDQYSSLHKAWEVEIGDTIRGFYTLKDFLDPAETDAGFIDGLNLYAGELYTKSANYGLDEVAMVSKVNDVPLFSTYSELNYLEFAEEFYAEQQTTLAGVFITSDASAKEMEADVVVRIYADHDGKPGMVIHQERLKFSFKHYSNGVFNDEYRDMNYQLENYVQLTVPQTVKGRFYVGVGEQLQLPSGFTVMNVEPRKKMAEELSSAWSRNINGVWTKSTENLDSPMNTSLLIAAYVKGDKIELPQPEVENPEVKAFYNKESKRIVIDSNTELMTWELFSTGGAKLAEGKSEGGVNRMSISAAQLPAGVYVVKVAADGVRKSLKVLVR